MAKGAVFRFLGPDAGRAVVIACLAVLGSLFVGYITFANHRENQIKEICKENLTLAHLIGMAVEQMDTIPGRFEKVWHETQSRHPGAYMCVVNASGHIAFHSLRPEVFGKDVGNSPLKGQPLEEPQNLLALVKAQKDYAGVHINQQGEEQVAAFAFNPSLNALVAVHVPTAVLQEKIWSASLPWAVGFGVIILILWPLAFKGLYSAYVRSRHEFEDVAKELTSRETEREHLITELRTQRRELAASEDQFLLLMAHLEAVFWLVEVSQSRARFLYVSPAYERIWGRSVENLYQDFGDWVEAIVPEDRERVERSNADFYAGKGAPDIKFRIMREDGEIRWVWVKRFWVQNENEMPQRIAGFSQDITDQAKLEHELGQAQKMEVVGQLAGGVAHDFNNILTSVLGSAYFLEKNLASNDPRLSDVVEIRNAAEHGAALTRQLLAFGKKQVIHPQAVQVQRMLEGILGMMKRVIGEHIKVSVVKESAERYVWMDQTQFEQVILNIVLNACDAMSDGGELRVGVKDARAKDATGQLTGEFVVVSIADTGVGMSEEILVRIFEPFFSTKGSSGTGLGLATAYGIIDQCGGHIEVESGVGEGTTFEIYIPRFFSENVSQDMKVSVGMPGEGAGKTLLVAEDEDAVRRVAVRILVASGYNVVSAANGIEAIEQIEAHPGLVEVVICDLFMPEMGGVALYEALAERHPDIPVIFMTGYLGDGIISTQSDLPENVPCIRKPFDIDELLSKVQTQFDMKGKHDG